jgi:hypothetical protein
MNHVSTFRLYLLRAAYLLIAVGLGLMIWPLLINAQNDVEHMRGVVWSLLGAVGLLAAVGIRYPLQMLPVLLFELVWKTIWIIAIGIQLRSAGALTAGTQETWRDCVVSIVLFLVVIPWPYVWANYVVRPSDQWKKVTATTTAREPQPTL